MSERMNKFSFESSYLVYELDMTEEVDTMAIGMIDNNKIEHILPINFHQIDAQKYLRYNISSTLSLSKFLGGTLSRERVLALFKSICEALVLSEEYLLDRAAFQLDPNYIFVVPSSGMANLVYLATLEDRKEEDLRLFFKRLLISIKPDNADGCSNTIGVILTYLNSNDHFSLHEFEKILQKQEKTAYKNNVKPQPERIPDPMRKQEPQKIIHEQKKPADQRDFRQSPVRPQPKEEKTVWGKEIPPANSPKEDVRQEPAASKKGSFEVPGGKKGTFEVPGGKKGRKEAPASDTEASEEKITFGWLMHNFSGENLAKYRSQKKEAGSAAAPEKKEKRGRNKGNQVLVLTSMDSRYPYSWVIDGAEFFIGRSKNQNQGIVSGVSNNISRAHCKIVKENGAFYVVDLRSSFGTTLDGVTCEPYKNSDEIKEGSVLAIPGISFKAEFRMK